LKNKWINNYKKSKINVKQQKLENNFDRFTRRKRILKPKHLNKNNYFIELEDKKRKGKWNIIEW